VPRVALGAGESALEVGEGVDQIERLERAVAPADRRLRQHAGIEEARNRPVDGLLAAANERRRAVHRDHRRAGQGVHEEIDRRLGTDLAERVTPGGLDRAHALLVGLGDGDRARHRCRG
jgi:hypothetical protein